MRRRFSWKPLAPGSEFRLELESTLRLEKTRWEASDALLLEIGRFKFIPWNEVLIEGKRGLVTMRKGERVLKPACVSLSNRLVIFKQLYAQHGEPFST
eukprot:851126-Pyramimonas_sp.AAC.1